MGARPSLTERVWGPRSSEATSARDLFGCPTGPKRIHTSASRVCPQASCWIFLKRLDHRTRRQASSTTR
eukprot:1024011-Alexandrium_andersonii.AAC.1